MTSPSDPINGVLEKIISEVRGGVSDVKGAYDSLRPHFQKVVVVLGGLYLGAIVSRVAFFRVSRYFRRGFPSVRRDLVNGIKGAIRNVETGKFITVYGAKGVGKTVAINHALRSFSSISVSIRPGTDSVQVARLVQTEIVSDKVPESVSKVASWRTVLWFHRLLTFGQPFVAVIRLEQNSANKEFPKSATEFGSAAKKLSVDSGGTLVVLIDASDNALTDFIEIQRASKFLVDYMSPSEIVEMRKFYPKLYFLATTTALADVLLACESVLGGHSLSWTELNDILPSAYSDNIPVYRELVLNHLTKLVNDNDGDMGMLLRAFRLRMGEDKTFSPAHIEDYSSQLSAALLQFRLQPDGSSPTFITLSSTLPKDLIACIPFPNKVLRKRGADYYPHTPVMAFILRHQIERKITPDELLALVAKERRSPWAPTMKNDVKLQ